MEVASVTLRTSNAHNKENLERANAESSLHLLIYLSLFLKLLFRFWLDQGRTLGGGGVGGSNPFHWSVN